MDELSPQDQHALGAQLEQSRQRLEGLLRERRAVEAELEEFATERPQFELLQDLCAGLEKLDELGASEMFWGARTAGDWGPAHLRAVRTRVDAFHQQLSAIEQSRQAIVDKILREEADCGLIEYELLEAQREEEERKLEWVVERDYQPPPKRPIVMPWTRGGEDDIRLRKSLASSLLLSLLLALLLPMIDIPIPERWEVIELPERFTRLVREEQPLPPKPPPVREEPKLAKQDPEVVEPAAPMPEQQRPEPAPQAAPSKPAAPKGILAFRDNFSGLAKSDPTAKLGSQARIRNPGEVASGRPQRALVATQAPGTSGGIDIAALSRDVGGAGDQIEGVALTQATSSIGGGQGSERPLSGGPGPARTDEEIQIVFDRHKAALYRLYNRELRRDPTLKGQMVLRMRIEADGSVTLCELQSSDMRAPTLVEQVLQRVRSFDFGAKEGVSAVTILYPIDFLPAAA